MEKYRLFGIRSGAEQEKRKIDFGYVATPRIPVPGETIIIPEGLENIPGTRIVSEYEVRHQLVKKETGLETEVEIVVQI